MQYNTWEYLSIQWKCKTDWETFYELSSQTTRQISHAIQKKNNKFDNRNKIHKMSIFLAMEFSHLARNKMQWTCSKVQHIHPKRNNIISHSNNTRIRKVIMYCDFHTPSRINLYYLFTSICECHQQQNDCWYFFNETLYMLLLTLLCTTSCKLTYN